MKIKIDEMKKLNGNFLNILKIIVQANTNSRKICAYSPVESDHNSVIRNTVYVLSEESSWKSSFLYGKSIHLVKGENSFRHSFSYKRIMFQLNSRNGISMFIIYCFSSLQNLYIFYFSLCLIKFRIEFIWLKKNKRKQ